MSIIKVLKSSSKDVWSNVEEHLIPQNSITCFYKFQFFEFQLTFQANFNFKIVENETNSEINSFCYKAEAVSKQTSSFHAEIDWMKNHTKCIFN